MSKVETIRVYPNEGCSSVVINRVDFDPSKHTPLTSHENALIDKFEHLKRAILLYKETEKAKAALDQRLQMEYERMGLTQKDIEFIQTFSGPAVPPPREPLPNHWAENPLAFY